MDTAHNPNFTVLLIVVMVPVCLLLGTTEQAFCMDRIPTPTVTVVDEETGKPIEGAVAIAIWRKPSWTKGAFFEGMARDVVRIEEAVSDRNGNIYIDGFWNWHLFEDRYPDLDIYKFGYVCWDKNSIFKDGEQTDLKDGNRVAHMKKWPEGFSFVKHEIFINTVTSDDFRNAPKLLFYQAYHQEISYIVKERDERDKKRKEEEQRNSGRDGQ